MIRPIVDLFKSECIVVYSYNTIYLKLTVHKAEPAVHGQQKTGTAPCPAPPPEKRPDFEKVRPFL